MILKGSYLTYRNFKIIQEFKLTYTELTMIDCKRIKIACPF